MRCYSLYPSLAPAWQVPVTICVDRSCRAKWTCTLGFLAGKGVCGLGGGGSHESADCRDGCHRRRLLPGTLRCNQHPLAAVHQKHENGLVHHLTCGWSEWGQQLLLVVPGVNVCCCRCMRRWQDSCPISMHCQLSAAGLRHSKQQQHKVSVDVSHREGVCHYRLQ